MDRNEPLIISHKFDYLPLRDPKIEPVELFEVMPSFKQSKAGEEFLQKYLAIVRTRLSRSLVEGWFNVLSTEVDSYLHLEDAGSDSDKFLEFMVQGFAMAACEDSYFEITKPDLMSGCAWDAMKSLTILQAMEGANIEARQSCLNALLSGYLRARVHREN